MLDVKTIIRLNASGHFCAAEGGRTQRLPRHIQLVQENLDEIAEDDFGLLMGR